MRFEGGCLCGTARFELNRSKLVAGHCYCSMCRRAHGTAFSTHAMVRPDQHRWLRGADNIESYRSSATGYREFCGSCGSHVLIHGQTQGNALAIPLGLLDGNPDVEVVLHMFVADCVSWYTISDDLPRYERWPDGVQANATNFS